MSKKHLTLEGLNKLKGELKELKEVKRKEVAERLEKCLAFGDLAENSEYHETKEAQAFLEGRILEIEDLINDAAIVSGSTILVKTRIRKEKFEIVGAEEANPLEGKISVDSPLGKALLNQPKGAIVEVNAPQGKIQYKILKIE